jgi:hypothetical protein
LLTELRYPFVHVHITDEYPCNYDEDEDKSYGMENPEASDILERVQRALREGGVSEAEIAAYTREATSRCYNHLLFTTMRWVCLHWDTPDYTTGKGW